MGEGAEAEERARQPLIQELLAYIAYSLRRGTDYGALKPPQYARMTRSVCPEEAMSGTCRAAVTKMVEDA